MKTARSSSTAPGSAGGASSAPPRQSPPHQEIADRARALWNKYGCPSGRDDEIWLEAERQLRGTDSAAGLARFERTAEPYKNEAAPKREAAPKPAPTGGGRRTSKNDEEELAIGAAAAVRSRRRIA